MELWRGSLEPVLTLKRGMGWDAFEPTQVANERTQDGQTRHLTPRWYLCTYMPPTPGAAGPSPSRHMSFMFAGGGG